MSWRRACAGRRLEALELRDEIRRREQRSPRLLALLDALQEALAGPAMDRRTLELAVCAYGAAADGGAELVEEDVDTVAAELLWPVAMERERRS